VVCVPTTVGLPIVNVPLLAPTAIVVPAPNRLPVVDTVLKTLAVVTPLLVLIVAVPVVALPLTVKVALPVLDPITNVAAPEPTLVVLAPPVAIFTVPVVMPVYKFKVPVVRSDVILTAPLAVLDILKVLLVTAGPTVTVTAPAALVPALIPVATPAKFTVVALVFNKLNVV